jgi:hypothetical protein
MKFMRRTAGYTLLDRNKNENVLEEAKVDLTKLLNYVSRVEGVRQLIDCRPIERRPGRLLNRLPDGYRREAETGHLLARLVTRRRRRRRLGRPLSRLSD